MGILSIILIIIGVLILQLLIRAAIASDDYSVQADVTINKPVAEVFDYVKYLDNQGNYNKWVMLDPNVRKEFRGTDGTVGFFYAWSSDVKQVGKGEQVIIALTPDKRVDYSLKFIEPFQSEAGSSIITEDMGNNQTKVTWSFYGKRNFMMKLMHIAMNLPKVLTKDLAASLGNLKAVLEK
ncbi:SRPBCC family protein [Mucilaginibacter mali]|uniref:SRPBCC family protein n=1 Tax=Mucilaginibacter mali TaxID=2740462 RepID=A0A7D4QMV0_9SPHI|nr:SRPBCC family protein [Mucilaginibacter mali]QKJ32110.1 SRPBCC family protein [Mucilaginibacter mali]